MILKKYLLEKGISLTSLQRMMEEKGFKLSRNSISNIVNGIHSPKVETLQQIADTLNIDIRELFAGNKQAGKDIYVKNDSGVFEKVGVLQIKE